MNFVTSYKFGKNNSWKADIRWNLGSGFPFTQTAGFYENLVFDDGIKTAEELFTKYDEVSEKVESEVENYTVKLNVYLPSDDSKQVTYSKKDAQKIRAYNSYLKGYEQISKGMDISCLLYTSPSPRD